MLIVRLMTKKGDSVCFYVFLNTIEFEIDFLCLDWICASKIALNPAKKSIVRKYVVPMIHDRKIELIMMINCEYLFLHLWYVLLVSG